MYDSVFASLGGTPAAAPPAGAPSSTDMAYGPSPEGSDTGQGLAAIFHPTTGFGLAFWLGIAGFAGLVIIYKSLPA